MTTKQEYEVKYQEQDRLVKQNIAIVQPFLEEFRTNYNNTHTETVNPIGRMFYEDVTILAGPHDGFYWDTEAGKRLRALHETGKVSIYCVKGADASFIIEYKFDGNRIYRYKDQVFQAPHSTPINSYFLYKGIQYPVSMDIAQAVKDLYRAQEYRGVLYGLINYNH